MSKIDYCESSLFAHSQVFSVTVKWGHTRELGATANAVKRHQNDALFVFLTNAGKAFTGKMIIITFSCCSKYNHSQYGV